MEQKTTVAEFVTAFQKGGGQMTIQTYYKLAKTGVVPKPDKGVIDAKLAAVKLALYYREMAERQAEGSTLTGERARLLKATADLKELELRKTEGELIDTGEAMYLWGGLMELTRARLMTVPEELSLALEGCTSPAEAEAISRAIIHRVLNELSDPSLRDVVRAAEQTI